jgi:hypothetical protein
MLWYNKYIQHRMKKKKSTWKLMKGKERDESYNAFENLMHQI